MDELTGLEPVISAFEVRHSGASSGVARQPLLEWQASSRSSVPLQARAAPCSEDLVAKLSLNDWHCVLFGVLGGGHTVPQAILAPSAGSFGRFCIACLLT